MSALRSFTGANSSAASVVFDHPVNLVSIDGIVGSAGYLMLFDRTTVPTNGTTPDIIIQCAAAGPAPGISNPQGVTSFHNGMAVALSSTNTTLTIAATTHSFWGQVEEWEFTDASLVSQPVTGVITNVWADPNTDQNRLVKFDITNDEAEARHLMLFAVDDPDDGAVPVAHWPLAASETKHLHFGNEGQEVRFYDTDGTEHTGCTFVVSSTAPLLTRVSSEAHSLHSFYRT